ncbi:hypothetical protein P691DRAFT_809725 [Macrolepiota fuliginosa MF-IS2]|uniref:Transmembrane protein n=1 Tax=Macrolepiota fuliginosa MF-IS2 TaxID=1400762 RepID=A0A9P6C406_9AGAR|nr:hypothetical protein P691DRAFT_809725 [Macrolepiota fuliginosa MF-IS2]
MVVSPMECSMTIVNYVLVTTGEMNSFITTPSQLSTIPSAFQSTPSSYESHILSMMSPFASTSYTVPFTRWMFLFIFALIILGTVVDAASIPYNRQTRMAGHRNRQVDGALKPSRPLKQYDPRRARSHRVRRASYPRPSHKPGGNGGDSGGEGSNGDEGTDDGDEREWHH